MSALPEPASPRWRWLFAAVGVYDLVLGLAFFLFYRSLFDLLDIELPANAAYLHLAAALIAVQGFSYLLVARRPVRNVDLVLVGVVYKAAYSALALYYWLIDEAPHTIFLWFGVVDAVVLVLLLVFLRRHREEL
ncbi:MAG: hypothetical protein ICV64_07405 [Thermoleophilia bacterium]|nr:hypothetical protein [Thermoleophilia bacterium]